MYKKSSLKMHKIEQRCSYKMQYIKYTSSWPEVLKNIVLAINFRVEAAEGGNAGEDVDLSSEQIWSTNSPCFPSEGMTKL